MASTYSTSLRLELMATGDQSGTWGDTTNTNLGTLLEQAITGYLSVAQGDVANLTLSTVNGGSDQARNAVVKITGALTATRNVVVQTANKMYTLNNATTGGFSIVAKTAAGTGVSIPPGATIDVFSDGTNVVAAQNYWSGQIGGAVWLDAGATVGPVYDLFRDSTSPAVSDIMGQVIFNGRDSAGNKQEYVSIESVITSPTSTTEGGQLDVYLAKAGARTKFLSLNATASALTGSAAYTMDAPLAVSNAAAGTMLTLTSTDAGAASGPNAELYRNSASPAANDILSVLYWYGQDSAANKQEYASTQVTIVDATSTSEDAVSEDYVTVGGARTAFLRRGALASGTADPNNVGLPLGQLSFPATQNPSSNANTLDDYEEGSWTPSFSASGSAFSYAAQTGVYTKIGNRVLFEATIILNAAGNTLTANPLSMAGLPFTVGGYGWSPPCVVGWVGATTSYVYVQGGIVSAGTTITFTGLTAAGTTSATALNANALLGAATSAQIRVSGHYVTS